jgi:hypothetical protein
MLGPTRWKAFAIRAYCALASGARAGTTESPRIGAAARSAASVHAMRGSVLRGAGARAGAGSGSGSERGGEALGFGFGGEAVAVAGGEVATMPVPCSR